MNSGTITYGDRVRRHTDPKSNQLIDDDTAERIEIYAGAKPDVITHRLRELDREWDMERLLQTNAATLALSGTLFGALIDRRWLLLPLAVTGFLLQHAVQGWCPPVAVLRRMGVRTRLEIERERYALKVLRGDFEGVRDGDAPKVESLLRSLDL